MLLSDGNFRVFWREAQLIILAGDLEYKMLELDVVEFSVVAGGTRYWIVDADCNCKFIVGPGSYLIITDFCLPQLSTL